MGSFESWNARSRTARKGFGNNVLGRVGISWNKAAEFVGRSHEHDWVACVSNGGTAVAIGWGPTPKAARHDAIEKAQASAAAQKKAV